MLYKEDEIFYSPKYINNKIINEIIKNPKIKKIIIPKSHYELMLKRNSNGIKRLVINGIDVEVRDKKGRPKKVNNDLKYKIINLYKEGHTILEISKILNIPKSTIWDNVGEELIKIKDDTKMEQFIQLVWEYKERLIENDLYDTYIETLFAELEMYVRNNELEKAKEILNNIIEYIHNIGDYEEWEND